MSLVDVSSAMLEVLKDLGFERAVDIARAMEIWSELAFVNDDIARVIDYESGVLVLGVKNSVWHQELNCLKDVLLERLNVISFDVKFNDIIIKEFS